MLHIVNVSGGMASAICLFRVIGRFGRENVRAVFADTNSEDADLYRFLDDVERVAGVQIDRLDNGGRNIWDVFEETGIFRLLNSGCKASWELKRGPLRRYHNGLPAGRIVYVGMSADEGARQDRLREAIHPEVADFPLNWPPLLSRCDLADELRAMGIEPPRIYALGYPHNNCGGACVLAGIKQWLGVLQDSPDLYRYHEEKEQAFLARLREAGRNEFTILRDRRGGVVNNLSLRQLRKAVESGERTPTDGWRAASCTCMGNLFARTRAAEAAGGE